MKSISKTILGFTLVLTALSLATDQASGSEKEKIFEQNSSESMAIQYAPDTIMLDTVFVRYEHLR